MCAIDSFAGQLSGQLEMRDLRLVVAVARTGSLTNAAKVLNLTQSTLSHHLAELENRINKPLFFRSGRRLTLTPEGDRFRRVAEPILERMTLMEHEVAGSSEDPSIDLRFATECYTTYPWFARIARKFKAEYPRVELKLVTEATARPLLELEHRYIDIAITSSDVRDRNVHVQNLFSDELVALVASDHPWAKAKRIAVTEFRHVHLMTYSKNPMDSDFVREILLPAGVVPLRSSGVQLTEALFEFARASLGVVVVARWAAANVLDRADLVPIRIGPNGVRRSWKAAWMRSHPNPKMLITFAKLLGSSHGLSTK
ncbi:MAG: LysR family transcriptional regulator [Candidatus Acidiferrum sp.]